MPITSILPCFERYSIVWHHNTFLSALLWNEISVLCWIPLFWYKSDDCFVWKAAALKMKELVSTTAVSTRHARAKICTTVLDWLPHSHFPAHMQHTRFVTCVDFDFSFKLMGVKFMYVNVISIFCFPVCIWPNEPNLEFIFSQNILFIWACCICASPILSKALWPHLLPLLNPACQASSSNTLGSRGQIWIEWMNLSGCSPNLIAFDTLSSSVIL